LKMYLTIFGKPRYLGLVETEGEVDFEKGEQLLIESSRGVETAIVAGEITERQEATYRAIDNRQDGQTNSDSGLRNVTFIRKANPEDLRHDSDNRLEEDSVLVKAREVLSRHSLDMKLVDVEYMNDRKKLFLYFTSEQRVDFRAYVRDLAREFKTRIELRQIGVRDEAKVVKGLGACGRVCCCSYWLQRFMPIGIKMVKEQNLALNPTKISGLCGRLMCCMSFEQDTYHELWKELPAHGSKIKTPDGTWVLSGVDLAAKTCSIRGPVATVNIPVKMYQQFRETLLSGKEWHNEEHGLDEKGFPVDQSIESSRDALCRACSACRVQKSLLRDKFSVTEEAKHSHNSSSSGNASLGAAEFKDAKVSAENFCQPQTQKNAKTSAKKIKFHKRNVSGSQSEPAAQQAIEIKAIAAKKEILLLASSEDELERAEKDAKNNIRHRRNSRRRNRRGADRSTAGPIDAMSSDEKGQY
jgi:cell fate regulator YaaT (PSP1 superfamily)